MNESSIKFQRDFYRLLLRLGEYEGIQLKKLLEESLSLIVAISGARLGYIQIQDESDIIHFSAHALGKPQLKTIKQIISSGIIAEVIDSKNTAFEKGDFVSGMLEWKEFQKSNGEGLLKVDASKAPLSAYLGVLGLTGLTAYLGLTEIGKPKKGETIVVSGAAGAVGSIVGQIAKLYGCKVIGIAGTDDKVTMLKSSLGFDEAINYNTTKNMTAAIKEAAPNGVDIYFDNVGGPISDAVLLNIKQFARFIICGAISVYNNTELPKSISVQPFLIKNSALMQGFIVFNYAEKYPEAIKQISQWLAEGKLSYSETIVEGFDAIPQTFLDLFEGKNKGKMLVKI